MQKAKKRLFSVTAVLLAVLVALTALLPTAGAAQAATMRSKYTGKATPTTPDLTSWRC